MTNEKTNTNKTTARIVGILYIIGTVAGILSLVFTGPVRNAQDSLTSVPASETRVVVGALFVLVMGLALAMVPVMMFPILRKHNEALALGYVIFRGGLEAVTYLAIATSWLLLVPLRYNNDCRTISDPFCWSTGTLLPLLQRY